MKIVPTKKEAIKALQNRLTFIIENAKSESLKYIGQF